MAQHYHLGEYIMYFADARQVLFTENETNFQRILTPGQRRM